MKIINFKELTKNTSVSELNRRALRIGILALGTVLMLATTNSTKKEADAKAVVNEEDFKVEKNIKTIKEILNEEKEKKEIENNNKKEISLLSCKVIVENMSDGTVRHHLVDYKAKEDYEKNDKYFKTNYEYQVVTDKDLKITTSRTAYNTADYYAYLEIPETRGQYIYDYNVPYFLMDINDLVLPDGYSLEELYSINELKELEKKLDASIYDVNKDKKYYLYTLYLMEVNNEFICFDFSTHFNEVTETTDKEDVTKLRNVYYVPSVGSNLVNLKVSSGKNAINDRTNKFNNLTLIDNYLSGNFVIEDITSLDQTVRSDIVGSSSSSISLLAYLNERGESVDWSTIVTEEEVEKILEELKEQEAHIERVRNK